MIDFRGNRNLLSVVGKSNQVDAGAIQAQVKQRRFIRAQGKMIQAIEEAAMPLPAEGEQLHLVTLEDFNAFTFVPLLIKQRGRIDHLVSAMYSISQDVTLTLCEMLDADAIGRIDLLISETINFRFPARIQELVEQANMRAGRFRVGVGRNHAKVSLMQCGADHYIVEGSGNWCHNARVEQYVFENSAEIWAFHRQWIESILEASGEADQKSGARRHSGQRRN